MSGPLFKRRMSSQMVNYRARNIQYPGDEKLRGATQVAKRYRGASDEGMDVLTLENNGYKAMSLTSKYRNAIKYSDRARGAL